MSACYVLMAANWIQVLLLFLAACLGWCVYACQSQADDQVRTARPRQQKQLAKVKRQESDPVPAQLAQPNATPAERVSVYRFPIHKISGNSFAEI
jgi:hypothetical protein